MADYTATDKATMAQTAKNFDTVNHELMGALDTLKTKVANLQSGWVGRGGTSFQTTMTSWSTNQKNINELLQQTATLIRSAGTSYTATDDNAATRLGNQADPQIKLAL
jgi:WXG100 family type VII secretion target